MPFPFLAVAGLALGAGGSFLSAGKKPKLPSYTPVDPTAEQANAIGGNLKNFGQASELAARTNEYNQSQLESLLRRSIPGYDDIISKSSEQIRAGLRGELPKDAQDLISRKAAERSVGLGVGGSGFARNLEARDLGLTSLQLSQNSLDRAGKFVSTLRATSTVSPMGPESMFLTPTQRLAAAVDASKAQYSAGVASAINDAAPDPRMAAIGNFASGLGGLLYGGFGAGGGGGGGGSGGVDYGGSILPSGGFGARYPNARPTFPLDMSIYAPGNNGAFSNFGFR